MTTKPHNAQASELSENDSTVPASDDSGDIPPPLPVIRKLDSNAPLRWLRKGWEDLLATRFRGVFLRWRVRVDGLCHRIDLRNQVAIDHGIDWWFFPHGAIFMYRPV